MINMRLKYLLLFFFLSFYVNSQSTKQPIPLVNYLSNVDAPFTSKELQMLKSVYKDKFEDYVIKNSNLAKALKHLLRNRLFLEKKPEYETIKKYKDLPKIRLKEGVFNKNSFNALEHKIDFFSNKPQLFQIENSNYYLIVKPQK